MGEKMPRWLNPKLGQRDNGTTLRHVYKRGEYEGDAAPPRTVRAARRVDVLAAADTGS